MFIFVGGGRTVDMHPPGRKAKGDRKGGGGGGGGGGVVSSGIKNHTISPCRKRNVFLLYRCPLVQDFATVSYDFILHGAVEAVCFTKLSATFFSTGRTLPKLRK